MAVKRIEIRWRDMDGFGHVNNSTYLTYLEEGRDEYITELVGETVHRVVIRRIEIDFVSGLTQDDDLVDVHVQLTGRRRLERDARRADRHRRRPRGGDGKDRAGAHRREPHGGRPMAGRRPRRPRIRACAKRGLTPFGAEPQYSAAASRRRYATASGWSCPARRTRRP